MAPRGRPRGGRHRRRPGPRGLAAALDAITAFVAGGDPFPSARRATEWLDRLPASLADAPEVQLLRAYRERIANVPGGGSADADRALEAFLRTDDVDRIAAAGFEVGLGAWLRGDLARIGEMYALGRRLRDEGHEHLVPLISIVEAVIADLQGDPARARALLDSVAPGQVPQPLVTLLLRERMALSQLLGDPELGVSLADQVAQRSDKERGEFVKVLAHWMAGDPRPAATRWPQIRHPRSDHNHDDFLAGIYSTLIDAGFGIVADTSRLADLQTTRTREVAFRAIATAAAHVAAGREGDAGDVIAALCDGVGLVDPLCIGELRRTLPVPYVLEPRVREALDATWLGPQHQRWRSIAQTLLAARRGTADSWEALDDPDQVVCALPLPWSVELVAHLGAAGETSRGRTLLDRLDELTGGRAGEMLRDRSVEADAVAAGARAMLAAIPSAPANPVRLIASDGPIVRSATEPDASLLRRERVRQLLGVLMVRGKVSADALVAEMWPELASSAAHNNLRITLTFVRRLLEPDRPPRAPSFHVGRDGPFIWLRRSPALSCDLWDIESALVAGDELLRAGDHAEAVRSFGAALDAWAGELLPELRTSDLAGPDLARIEMRLSDACALVAEWSLAQGDPARCVTAAERLLRHDPYHERGHAALIGAHLASGDLAAARAGAQRCRDALDELRVAPSPPTAMVLRRVGRALDQAGMAAAAG